MATAALVLTGTLLSGALLWALRRPARHDAHVAPPDLAPWETLADTERVLPPAEYEHSDMRFRPLLLGGFAVLAVLVSMGGLAYWLYPKSVPDKELGSIPGFPAPMLQPDVAADMADFTAEQLGKLQNPYWLDRRRGIVHMPIEDAMRDVARRGIPDWPRR